QASGQLEQEFFITERVVKQYVDELDKHHKGQRRGGQNHQPGAKLAFEIALARTVHGGSSHACCSRPSLTNRAMSLISLDRPAKVSRTAPSSIMALTGQYWMPQVSTVRSSIE